MDFKGFVTFLITSFITPATKLILALSVIFFLWNIMQVIRKSDQPDELAKFKSKAVWGVVAIAVSVSMWGLVNFLTRSASLDMTRTTYPTLPGSN